MVTLLCLAHQHRCCVADMVEFPEVKELKISKLEPAVRMNVERLGQLALAFRDGQEVLESDRFAASSHFIGGALVHWSPARKVDLSTRSR
jgi:hypothetical protein